MVDEMGLRKMLKLVTCNFLLYEYNLEVTLFTGTDVDNFLFHLYLDKTFFSMKYHKIVEKLSFSAQKHSCKIPY